MPRFFRQFSVLSFIGILCATVVLSYLYHRLTLDDVVSREGRANVALARSLIHSLWPHHGTYVRGTGDIPAIELASRPETTRLREDVARLMQALKVDRVRLYNSEGTTVFATDTRHIGEDALADWGFVGARGGEVVSHITTIRDRLGDNDLLLSYVPVYGATGSTVEGVIAVGSDVSDLLVVTWNNTIYMAIGILVTLLTVYFTMRIMLQRAGVHYRRSEAAKREGEAEIRHLAYHDGLTGLPNRLSFLEQIEDVLEDAETAQNSFAVLFVDLDRFKLINDSLGHDAGDELLRVAARRIRNCIRDHDRVYRIGGDEFTVILRSVGRPEDVSHVARRLTNSLSRVINLRNHDVIVNASIGIALYPDNATEAERLISDADAAMYQAKQAGGNCYKFFTADMSERALDRLELETALQRALEENQFRLYYQPKIDLAGGRIMGVEALLRWEHPDNGLIPPASFIPFLESTGLITPVGDWVLRTACRQARAWLDADMAPISVSVNVSARQFASRAVVKSVREALRESGLPPQYLELELTESLLMNSADSAIDIMMELKALGVQLSIDDFGSGYSSLSYLSQFPVDTLKIDRSFIRNINTSEKNAAITTAIASLAHSLNLDIVAEGVEETAQIDVLREQGCQIVQGFLFSKPLPAEEITDKLSSETPLMSDIAG